MSTSAFWETSPAPSPGESLTLESYGHRGIGRLKFYEFQLFLKRKLKAFIGKSHVTTATWHVLYAVRRCAARLARLLDLRPSPLFPSLPPRARSTDRAGPRREMSALSGAPIPPSSSSPPATGTSPRIAAAAWAAARARDSAATRPPVPEARGRALPPPPPLRDGISAAVAGDARSQTRAALWRLVAVAHALAPAPLPPKGAAHPAALDWVAERLEAFGDRIEKAREPTAAPVRVIEPVPWPPFPAAAAKTVDGRTNSTERNAARPPRHPSSSVVRERRGERPNAHISGAVMSRARQLEALLGGNVSAAPLRSPTQLRASPPPPPPPPPLRTTRQPLQPSANSLPIVRGEDSEGKRVDAVNKVEIDRMEVDHKPEEDAEIKNLDLPLSPAPTSLQLPLSPSPHNSEKRHTSSELPLSPSPTSLELPLSPKPLRTPKQVVRRQPVAEELAEEKQQPNPYRNPVIQTSAVSEHPALFDHSQEPDSQQRAEWDKPFRLGSPPPPADRLKAPGEFFTSSQPSYSEGPAQQRSLDQIPLPRDSEGAQKPFSPQFALSPDQPISPLLDLGSQHNDIDSGERNFTPASEILVSPTVPPPAFNAEVLQRHADPLMPPIGSANGPFGTSVDGMGKRASSDGSIGAHGMPKIPSGLDLPTSREDSSASRPGELGGHFLRLPSETSTVFSRGSEGRARLRADYDRIYNRPSDVPFPQNESQIKVAGGDLFIDGPVEGRWKMERKIGEGGFSTVYKASRKPHERYAKDTTIPEACAIKVISKRPEPFNRRMVEREVFSYRLLEMVGGHENIVRLYEVSEDEEHVYLVMELLEGGELFSRISERGQYTERDAANLVVSMLASLCFCHRLNLIHRDVKPENFVFLKKANNEAELKLTDFGIAHYSEDPEAVCKTMCGTPLYIAPEVLFRQPYGAEADLWSLGVIVYIMLSGYPPFHDHDIVRLVKKIKYKPVTFDGPEWVLISEQGKEFLANLLDKDKSNRMSAQQALEHEWLQNNCHAATRNVLEVAQVNIKSFVTRKRWKVAIQGVKAMNKFAKIVDSNNPGFSDHSGPPTTDSIPFGVNGPQTPNAAALEEYHASTVGNFTVATEDTLNDSDPGSLWQRLKRDRFPQPRRPRSRHTSRFAASRDRAARLDGGFGRSGDLTPQSSYDSRTLRPRDGRTESANLMALASSPEPLSSSLSSVDPASGGATKSPGAAGNRASPRNRMLRLWKGSRLRVTSHISDPATTKSEPQERLGTRLHRSQHLDRRDGSLFKLFR